MTCCYGKISYFRVIPHHPSFTISIQLRVPSFSSTRVIDATCFSVKMIHVCVTEGFLAKPPTAERESEWERGRVITSVVLPTFGALLSHITHIQSNQTVVTDSYCDTPGCRGGGWGYMLWWILSICSFHKRDSPFFFFTTFCNPPPWGTLRGRRVTKKGRRSLSFTFTLTATLPRASDISTDI